MVDNSQMKLGRNPPRNRIRGLPKMRRYLSKVDPPPASKDWTKGVTDFGMMGNDVLGDCTCAAVGHAIQVWTLNASTEQTLSDQAIISLYSASCGYVPGDPSTDQGGDEQTVLSYWQRNGVRGHKLDAWAVADVTNHTEIQQSIWLLGGVYIAVELPLTAQHQDVWDVVEGAKPWWKFWARNPSAPGSWGGHAIFVPAYQEDGDYWFISWGKKMRMTKAFWDKYVVEAHPLLSKDFIRNNLAPSGFTYQVLAADMPSVWPAT